MHAVLKCDCACTCGTRMTRWHTNTMTDECGATVHLMGCARAPLPERGAPLLEGGRKRWLHSWRLPARRPSADEATNSPPKTGRARARRPTCSDLVSKRQVHDHLRHPAHVRVQLCKDEGLGEILLIHPQTCPSGRRVTTATRCSSPAMAATSDDASSLRDALERLPDFLERGDDGSGENLYENQTEMDQRQDIEHTVCRVLRVEYCPAQQPHGHLRHEVE